MGIFPSPNPMGFFPIMIFVLFIMLIGHCCGQIIPPDKKDEWKPCNWKNVSNNPKKPSGNNKIFFTVDNCETYLICYKSKLDPATHLGGKAKLSRRFWVENKNAEYLNCRRGDESLDGWHAVKKSKGKAFGDRANAESKNGEFLEDFANFDLAAWEFTRNDSTKCRAKCALTPSSRRIDHQNTSCTEITIPVDSQSFLLNISFNPIFVCEDPTNEMDFHKWADDPKIFQEKYAHACDYAPLKCQSNNTFELFLCYNASNANKETSFVNKRIADFCAKHLTGSQNLNPTTVHGVLVGVCFRRVNISGVNGLLLEAYVQLSFSDKGYNFTRQIPLDPTTHDSFEYSTRIQDLMLINFDQNHTTVYEMPNKKKLLGLGRVFSHIVSKPINGTWAKQLHFVPPNDPVIYDQTVTIYFQMERPSVFSTLISKEVMEDWRNDPQKNQASTCDLIENCEEVRRVLLEMRKILTWCNPNDPSGNQKTDPDEFKVPSWVQRSTSKPEPESEEDENDNPFENTDILYTLEQALSDLEFLKKRCGMVDMHEEEAQKRQAAPYINNRKWKLPIQVKVDEKLPDTSAWKKLAQDAIETITDSTCVTFTFKVTNKESGVLVITKEKEEGYCGRSLVGHFHDSQELEIKNSNDCFNRGVAAHEFLHALGLNHEHSRSDAYQYVKINWFKVNKKDEGNYAPKDTQNYGMPYDFGSVMHYPGGSEDAYELITIPRFYQRSIGQQWQPSFKDIKMINKIYCDHCSDKRGGLSDCQNGGYPNPKDCQKCLCPSGYTGYFCQELAEDYMCSELSSRTGRHITADWQTRTMRVTVAGMVFYKTANYGEYEANSYQGYMFSKCHWSIKPKPGEKVIIRLKSLYSNFECEDKCKSYVEIKYRADKSAAGIRLCCPEELNENFNWIEAEKADQEIIIFTHIQIPSMVEVELQFADKYNPSTTMFELTYETDGAKIEPASNCPNINTLYKKKRNPGTMLKCYDENGKPKPCLDDERTEARHIFRCPGVLFINDKREVRRRNASHDFNFECYKKTDESQSFWGYWKDKNGDPIRVGEIQCVRYKDAGFKTDEDIDKVAVDP